MATSALKRRNYQHFALRRMLQFLGDRAAGSSGFYSDDATFADVSRATWAGLVKKELIRMVDFMGGRPVCFLTGAGWKKALQISGAAQSPEFTGRLAIVERNLSERVQGCEAPAQVSLYEVAADTGIPEGFIWNLIESGAIGEDSPYWGGNGGEPYMIEIPLQFAKAVQCR